MTTTFAQLGVPASVCDALEQRGILAPFDIQAATIADALAGRDVCGRAPTGSGKTLAFGIPMVVNATRASAGRPTALVLAPTRELAEQITTELRTFSGRLRVDAVYGGVGYGKQLSALRRGIDILVACPGRLEDLIERGDVDLGDVAIVVLDEADRMADMGFMPAVRRLLDQTSPDRQTVLFSATLDGDVATLTREYQRDAARHEVGEETPDVRSAEHRFYTVDRMERNPVVADVVNSAWPSIVFTRTRHGADRLARQLGKLGFEAAPIHGGLSQSQRNRALDAFTNGRVHALVATDVAARGIHVDGVASVIHYDPPEDHKTYVHRSGRTARAGADGLVVSLVQPDQRKAYRRIQHDVGLDVAFAEPVLNSGPTVIEAVQPAEPVAVVRERGGNGKNQRGATRTGHRDARGRDGSRGRDDRGRNGRSRDDGAGRDDRGRSGRSRDDRAGRVDGAGRVAGAGRVDRGRSDGADRDDRGRSGGAGRDDRGRDGRASYRSRDDRNGSVGSGDRGSSGDRRGTTRGAPSGSRSMPAPTRTRSGKPSANNRKARRAHLQPNR